MNKFEGFPRPAGANQSNKKKSETSGFLERLSHSSLGKIARLTALSAGLILGADRLEAKEADSSEKGSMTAINDREARTRFHEIADTALLTEHFRRQLSESEQELTLARGLDGLSDTTDIDKLPDGQREYYQAMDNRLKKYRDIMKDPDAYLDWLEKRSLARRQSIIDHFNSADFLEKLQQELGGSLTAAEDKRDRLIDNLFAVRVNFISPDQLKERYGDKVTGHYNDRLRSIDLPFDQSFDDSSGETAAAQYSEEHELFHAAYRGEQELSEKFIDKAEESFRSTGGGYDDYLKKSGEKIVRKKILDLELEKSGIKKYNEPFTKEHYQELLKRYEDGSLNENIKTLIDSTRPEEFESLMNDFAQTGSQSQNFKNIT